MHTPGCTRGGELGHRGEVDGVGWFIGVCSVAKMMVKTLDAEGRKANFLHLIGHSEEVLIGAGEPHGSLVAEGRGRKFYQNQHKHHFCNTWCRRRVGYRG